MWRILHLEVLVGETSGLVKLEEMRRFVLEEDLERRMAASDTLFTTLYTILNEFCVPLIMDTVIRQIQALRIDFQPKQGVKIDTDENVTNLSSASIDYSAVIDELIKKLESRRKILSSGYSRQSTSDFSQLLHSASLHIEPDVICWKNLRTLTITFGRFDDDLFHRIISGSPVLETLVLCSCYGFDELDISDDSVKNFVICGYSSEMDTLRINAPHIESLTIKGDFDLKAILLLNKSSVIQAQLYYSNTKVFYAMEMHEHHQMNEELFKGLILSLLHVKGLKVGKSCLESEGQWIMTLQRD
nr:F-box/LRR-repeat protein 25-like [Tanacetum cinerariifolium]